MLWFVCTLHVLKTLPQLFARLNFKLKGGTNYLDIRLLGHLDIRIDKMNIRCSPNNYY